MRAGFGISVTLCKSKIDNEDNIFFIAFANHKIISFDVSVNKALAMNGFEPVNNLYSDLEDSTDGEPSLIGLKQILEGTIKQINNHKNLLPLVPIIMELGNAGYISKIIPIP